MPDYGMLGGLAEGLKQGLLSYKEVKEKQKESELAEQKMSMEKLSLQSGLLGKGQQVSSTGALEETPDALKNKRLETAIKIGGLKKDGLIPTGEAAEYDMFRGGGPKSEKDKIELETAKAKLDAARMEKAPKDKQLQAAGFGKRALEADKIASQLESAMVAPVSSTGAGLLNAIPFGAGEGLKSNDRKSYEQAQRNFVTAVLRPESGASITESEMDSAIKQYFGQQNDGPDQLAQKKQAREQAIENLRGQAGGAWNHIETAENPNKKKKEFQTREEKIKFLEGT